MTKFTDPFPPDEGGYQLPEAIPIADDMNPREKALRDLFVSEYLVDYDALRAAQRCGFNFQFAVEYAKKFMQEPYVQQQINAVKFREYPEHDVATYEKKRIMASLIAEAHYKGPGSSHSSRVAALSKLASIYGMDAPKKIEQSITNRGGVMAVPGIAKLDDWENAASQSQDALVQHARDN